MTSQIERLNAALAKAHENLPTVAQVSAALEAWGKITDQEKKEPDMTEYNDWKIWNATPDSVCPVPNGTKGQAQMAYDTRLVAARGPACRLNHLEWSCGVEAAVGIIAFRTVKEPKTRRLVNTLGCPNGHGIVFILNENPDGTLDLSSVRAEKL